MLKSIHKSFILILLWDIDMTKIGINSTKAQNKRQMQWGKFKIWGVK